MSTLVRRSYGLLDTAIEVTSDVPAALDWLDEFLTPAFEIRPAGDADFAVAIVAERAAYDHAASTRPPGVLANVECFARDREVTRRPSWTVSGSTVVDNPRDGILFRIAGRRVDILVHPAPDKCRPAALMVIREIATSRALASPDRMQLHAAGLEAGGLGLLLAGPKGAGKTTLLGYLAASTGARILANDRVLLSRTGGGADARGIPTIVSVRAHSRRFLPCSFAAVPGIDRPAHLTVAEADAARARAGGRDETAGLKLSPAQLARELGVSLSPHARLAAIAFPQANPDAGGFAIDRLDPTAAERSLLEARFGLRSGKIGTTLFERLAGSSRPPRADEAFLGAIARTTPCFAVSMGARLFADPRSAHALLSACLDA